MTLLKKIIKSILFIFQFIFISLYIILEELIWDRFAKPIYVYIKRLRIFKRLEIILSSFNRYAILIIFLLSFLIGELFGLLSPVVALNGYVIFAILLYILKIIVVAFAFWLFNIQKEKLLSFFLIDYSYKKILHFTNWIKNTNVFIKTKEIISKSKELLKGIYLKLKVSTLSFIKNILK